MSSTNIVQIEPWKNTLIKTDKGTIIGCEANVLTALQRAPELRERFIYDEFADNR